MLSPLEIDLLERRLLTIDKLLAENALRLASAPPHSHDHNNYERQEYESERRELLDLRDNTKRKLNEAHKLLGERFRVFRRRRPDPQTARQSATLDSLEAERRESIAQFVKRLEAEGDYRQARLWRLESVTARAALAREYGFV
ncbi:MAG TPA: hypothetical protein VFB29_04830 [Pseudolabrys sp.]|nr:hypothetical protein [Pseudolabrys sp.]